MGKAGRISRCVEQGFWVVRSGATKRQCVDGGGDRPFSILAVVYVFDLCLDLCLEYAWAMEAGQP